MESIIVNIKLPSHRVYELAWAVAKRHGYGTLDQYINGVVLDSLEMYPEGRDSLQISDIDWGLRPAGKRRKKISLKRNHDEEGFPRDTIYRTCEKQYKTSGLQVRVTWTFMKLHVNTSRV